jgi:heat shock protein HslJ
MRYFLCLTLLLPLLGLAACTQGGGGNPATPAASARSFQAAEWTLVELDGGPVATAEGRRAPTLTLAGSSASGFAGCNRLSGSYESAGDSLTFGAMVTTRMHCEGAMALEQRYLAALEATRRYRVAESGLELLDAAGAVLARFTTS